MSGSVYIDPETLDAGAGHFARAGSALQEVNARLRGLPEPEGISARTTGDIDAAIAGVHALGMASHDQVSLLHTVAAKVRAVDGAGKNLTGPLAQVLNDLGSSLPLRTPFPLPPARPRPPKKPSKNPLLSVLSGVGSEVLDETVDTIKTPLDIADTLAHPRRTAAALAWAATHPDLMAEALVAGGYADAADDYHHGDKAKAGGRAAVATAATVLPFLKLRKLAEVEKLVKEAKALEAQQAAKKAAEAAAKKAKEAARDKLKDAKEHPLKTLDDAAGAEEDSDKLHGKKKPGADEL